MLVVYNRDWDPFGLLQKPVLRRFAEKHYGYVPERNADEIASALSMRVVERWTRRGLSMELLARDPKITSESPPEVSSPPARPRD